jgi:antitoxin component HigA of HigAB toxin-antitoxin module
MSDLIENQADHQAALKTIESLMLAKSGTAEGEQLDRLVEAVASYEKQAYPINERL